ncbi:hypothetical protein FJV41_31295 [Myxococcus llanfairpwllgwyngyllgogerychwyrndrobwllllantysiliogogogochensis]|uniref:Uncharacterized protein n=1 Tax=Myxococcus llanfairpwllgwyngyllgogerychwyrndrobwllllantysiliogogogochensis TaxID=2590453 RepID=A0A540WU90_9BACT|nr:hypothetical protein [Myxococcus llanfairpwllgwyngyllgogerychwyrndrobwllllantysiliogogogochensis]TQF12014.1 hypothetical protein FJV41_31295 [Myxococcus llanfairpwllgwyngyllgogerychwyrndrobwllllantysiliogogogochensis]
MRRLAGFFGIALTFGKFAVEVLVLTYAALLIWFGYLVLTDGTGFQLHLMLSDYAEAVVSDGAAHGLCIFTAVGLFLIALMLAAFAARMLNAGEGSVREVSRPSIGAAPADAARGSPMSVAVGPPDGPGMTPSGRRIYNAVRCSQGTRVLVQESCEPFYPHCWLALTTPFGNEAAAHLAPDQAHQLRAALDEFLSAVDRHSTTAQVDLWKLNPDGSPAPLAAGMPTATSPLLSVVRDSLADVPSIASLGRNVYEQFLCTSRTDVRVQESNAAPDAHCWLILAEPGGPSARAHLSIGDAFRIDDAISRFIDSSTAGLDWALEELGWSFAGWDHDLGFGARRRCAPAEASQPPEVITSWSCSELLDLARARPGLIAAASVPPAADRDQSVLQDMLDTLGWEYCGWDDEQGFRAERRSAAREEWMAPPGDQLTARSQDELIALVHGRVRAALAACDGARRDTLRT